MTDFVTQYGPWALIAGGAQGIGEAYARYAAAQGLNVIAIDMCASSLEKLGASIKEGHAVEYLGIELDLASEDLLDTLVEQIGQRQVGLLIYNAGLADVGPFYKPDTGLEYEQRKIAVNVTGPLLLTYHFAKPMLARGTGGILLMSSGAGLQGAPYYAHYSATKAYDIALAEALWGEFKPLGVDVMACIAGMTLSTAAEGFSHLDTSEFQTTDELVEEAMAALGKQCSLIAGAKNRENRTILQTLPRDQQVEIIGQHAIDNFLNGKRPKQAI